MNNLPSSSTGNDDSDNRKRNASSAEVGVSEEPTSKYSKSDDADFSSAKCPGGGGDGGPPPKVTIVERITPCQSPNDPNEYRVLRLSSGLTVVLISRKAPIDNGDKPDSKVSSLLNKVYPNFGKRLQQLSRFSIPDERIQPSHHYLEAIFPSMGPKRSGDPSFVWNFLGGGSPIFTTDVALAVNMGGLNDPVNCQGLAHFMEHMVHYGSRKFPQEGAIMRNLVNFGYFNAFTTDHITAYFNQVSDDMLGKSLEMFSGMLSEPSFSLSLLPREVQVVDHEFYLRTPLFRTLVVLPYVAIKNQDHPLCRLLCGKLETLTDCTGRNGQKTQGAMKSAHNRNYVASAMTLAINSTKPLAEMEQLTLTHFSSLRQGQHQVLHKMEGKAASDKIILQNTAKSHYTYLQGNSNMATLLLSWFLPASLWTENPNAMVVDVIYYMLADTSDKSLSARLHNEGLIWMMGMLPVTTHYATVYHVIMGLTETGRKNTSRIIRESFAFIEAIRKTPESEMQRFFGEIQVSNLRNFHFGSQYCSVESTIECAMRLQNNETLGNAINGASWKDAKLDFQAVISGLKLFQQNNLVILETIPKSVNLNQIKTREKSKAQIHRAPHSGAQYLVVGKKMDYMSSSSRSGNRNLFGIPKENYYLKDEYEKGCSGNGSGDTSPALITPDNHGDIKFQMLNWESKQDSKGEDGRPKIMGVHVGHRRVSMDPYIGVAAVIFISSLLDDTPQTQAISFLWATIIQNKMEAKLSELDLAGYKVMIIPGNWVLVIGFPKHMEQVIGTVMSAVLDSPVTEQDFRMGKTYVRVMWDYVMSGMGPTSYLVGSLTRPSSSIDLGGTINELTLNELNCSIQSFRNTASCIVLLVGNVPVESFKGIAANLDKKEFGPRLDLDEEPKAPAIQSLDGVYSPGETCIRTRILSSFSLTTTVENLYILGPMNEGDKRMAYFDAAMFFINCESFMHLRTQKHLGYVVKARERYIRGAKVPVLMFSVHVTSTAHKFTPCELDKEIDTFLTQYGGELKKMDNELFNRMKQMSNGDESLTKEEVGNWFSSIFDKSFLTQDFRIRCPLKGIRKVSVQVLSGSPDAKHKPCLCEKCRNISGWKRGGGYESEMEFAVGKGEYCNYFIGDPNDK